MVTMKQRGELYLHAWRDTKPIIYANELPCVLFQAIVRYLTYGYASPRIPQKHFITTPAMIGWPRLTHPGQPPI